MLKPFRQLLLAACVIGAATAAVAGNVQVQVLDKDRQGVPGAVVILYPTAPVEKPVATNVTIEQKRMRFLPLVTVVAPGSTLRFTNLDRWDHHIRGTSNANPLSSTPPATDFELRLDGGKGGEPGGVETVTVTQPGAVLLGCHLHSSMRGHLFVTDSGYTLVTDENGIARFDRVPEGIAKLRVWHPEQLLELPQRPLTVGNEALLEIVTLTVVPRRRR